MNTLPDIKSRSSAIRGIFSFYEISEIWIG